MHALFGRSLKLRQVCAGGCNACHDGVRAPGKPPGHVPTTASCDQCHGIQAFALAGNKPANHIPYAATAQCTACHTAGNFSVMPTLTSIHANAPSTTGNCAQCHGPAAAWSWTSKVSSTAT